MDCRGVSQNVLDAGYLCVALLLDWATFFFLYPTREEEGGYHGNPGAGSSSRKGEMDFRGVSKKLLARVPAQLARRATVFCLCPTREEGDWTLFISELIDRARDSRLLKTQGDKIPQKTT